MKKEIPDNVDVLFIMPPMLRFFGKTSWSFPLGIGYMVSCLKKSEINAYIYNADYQSEPQVLHRKGISRLIKNILSPFKQKKVYSETVTFANKWPDFNKNVRDIGHRYWQEVKLVLSTLKPKIIGISAKVIDIPSTLMLAHISKEILPNSKIVIGGISALTSGEYLMSNPNIDFLVLHEGEETIVELSNFILGKKETDISSIRGLVYRDSMGLMRANQPRPLISDLDTLPFPDRESLFYLDADNKFKFYVRADDILTSRGCPFPCKFCAAHVAWGTKRPRSRSIDNVIEEIINLKKAYGQTHFVIWDDLFTTDSKRVYEFCRKIIDLKLEIKWLCLVRISDVDAGLLAIMKMAGCYEIQVGVESGNDRILKLINKRLTIARIREKIPVIRESGLNWRAFFIIGFPSETEKEMQETLDFISEIKPTYAQLSVFCPYPGTEFYNELTKSGTHLADFKNVDLSNPNNNFTCTMPDTEFRRFVVRALEYVDNLSPPAS